MAQAGTLASNPVFNVSASALVVLATIGGIVRYIRKEFRDAAIDKSNASLVVNLERQIERLTTRIDNADADRQKLREQIFEQGREMARTQGALDAVQAENLRLRGENQKHLTDLVALQVEVAGQMGTIQELTGQVDALKRGSGRRVDDHPRTPS